MRYFEFSAKNPTAAKTPAQLRIHALQQQIEAGRRALAAERLRQQQAKERQRAQRAAQRLQAMRP